MRKYLVDFYFNTVQALGSRKDFIGKLSPREKDVYDLHWKKRYKLTAVSKNLGISDEAVSQRLMNISRKAREYVSSLMVEHDKKFDFRESSRDDLIKAIELVKSGHLSKVDDFFTSISDIGLEVAQINSLHSLRIHRLGNLVTQTRRGLGTTRNLGNKGLDLIEEKLRERDCKLSED